MGCSQQKWHKGPAATRYLCPALRKALVRDTNLPGLREVGKYLQRFRELFCFIDILYADAAPAAIFRSAFRLQPPNNDMYKSGDGDRMSGFLWRTY
jgi:hypothetical protein